MSEFLDALGPVEINDAGLQDGRPAGTEGVLTMTQKRVWDENAHELNHGDYWEVFDPDTHQLAGYAIVCPVELIPEVLHRHWFDIELFRETDTHVVSRGELYCSEDHEWHWTFYAKKEAT